MNFNKILIIIIIIGLISLAILISLVEAPKYSKSTTIKQNMLIVNPISIEEATV